MHLRRSTGWAALVVALTAAACGSPAGDGLDVGALLADEATAGSVTTVPGEATGDLTAPTTSGSAPTEDPGAAQERRATGSRSRSSGDALVEPPPPQGRLGPATGHGFTESEITIGVETLADITEALNAIGGEGGDYGDPRAQAQAMVDWLNRTGGIGGRKVVPVYHETDPAAGSWDTQAQASCSAFTEDNEVFAVQTAYLHQSFVLAACLHERGIPLVANGRTVFDDEVIAGLRGTIFIPGRMSASRWGRTWVDGLHRSGYFSSRAVVGLVRFDSPVHARTVRDAIRPALASHGIALTEEQVVSYPGSVGQFSSTSASIGNAILRLRSRGVDHLLVTDDHGTMAFLFMPQAESQGYRPRYGLNSVNQLVTVTNNQDANQLRRSIAIGWVPVDDTGPATAEQSHPQRELCLQIFRAAGVDFPAPVAMSSALGYCDGFLFLRAALERAPALGAEGLVRGVEALGSSYLSPVTYGTTYGPGRYDGAAAYATLAYDEACGCYRQVSGPDPSD